jgi:pyruvate/2-oxoglutarate dehydrogenase complex dihydrolipoamide dehydrogenase (E3) component
VPNVDGLGLDEVGVAYDNRTGVHVDDRLRTTNPRIFAAGDICFPYKFTHTADALARIVIQNALFWGRKKASVLNIPWCTFTDPEIAHVGMYENDAENKGIDVHTITIPMSDVDRSIAEGETEGMVRIHLKKGTDRILGATIVARHAGEMISEISVAMGAKMGLGSIAGVIHPYPTQAEAIRKAGDAYNRTRLTPTVKSLFERILKWQL